MAVLNRRALAPAARIRVLIVDDSVVIRRLVAHALSEDPEIEVVGFATDGAAALKRIAELSPDVVTLDIEMPVMNGLETLRNLKAAKAACFVIMFSTLTERGAAATIEALSLGASDYVAKAANVGKLDRSMDSLREQLIPKVKQFFSLGASPARVVNAPALAVIAPRLKPAQHRQVVVIGVSTGGPNALASIIPMFPAVFPLPVLIVQHMPATFTRLLAERLDTLTPLKVREAKEGSPVEAGTILIAPGDHHMTVKRTENGAVFIALNEDEPEHFCRPSVDVLFRSVAAVYGGGVIAAVLTGMGFDGTTESASLHEKGAWVIAQDEATSVVWGMPQGVVRAGAADVVLALNAIVPEIVRNV
jgi:two-component system chemotaxis response regulator CheB